MRFSILGPLQVHDASGHPVTIGGARLRAFLTLLLLRPGQPVTVERLTDAIWGEDVPAAAGNALQALASRLRRALGTGTRLHSDSSGYRLEVAPDQVDLYAFEVLVRDGRAQLLDGQALEAERTLSAAVALWRGPALPDLTSRGVAEDTALRLSEAHQAVLEDHLWARLELGRHAEALPEAEELAARQPLRERPVELLMRALAGNGRTAEALAAHEGFRNRLAEELGLDPSPRLRDTHLRLLRGELAPDEPGPTPPSPEAATPGPGAATPRPETPPPRPEVVRLPRHLTSFVPRDTEVSAAVERMAAARLLTLTGPGGAGKTRLATESAAALAERVPQQVPDGVWFVELAPVREGADVPDAVAAALDLRVYAVMHARAAAAPQPSEERVLSYLGARSGLLVLDNCEHLVDEAARFAQTLLANCPRLHILTTSREPLGVPGESLLPVPSLPLPPKDADAATARANPAVALFAERAEAVRPGFAVGPDNVDHVVRITRELDGMPLALELAAARLRAMSPAQLAARLSDRFRLLTSGSRSALPRHRTLRGVVDWSWELLDEPERRLLRRLAVFPGGATLEAVERVGSDPAPVPDAGPHTGSPTVAGQDVWEALFALVDKSLVTVESPEHDDTPPRYRQLETVRAYAAEQLTRSGEEERVRDAQARYVRDLWRRAEPELRGRGQRPWLARLARESDNCVAAFRWAIERRDACLALDLVEHSQWYWTLNGGWRQLHRWSKEALELVGDRPPEGREIAYASCVFHRTGDMGLGRQGILDGIGKVEDVLARVDTRPESHPVLVSVLAYKAMAEGNPDSEPRKRLEAALDWVTDPWLRATVSFSLALLDAVFGQAHRALRRSSDAFESMGALGDAWGQCNALMQMVDVVRFTDLERSRLLLTEGIALAEGSGLEGISAMFRTVRARTLVDLGDLAAAAQDLAEVAGAAAEEDHLVILRQVRAQLLRAEGRTAEARTLVDETEPVVTQLGGFAPAYIEPSWRILAAEVAWDEGDTARAWAEAGRGWWLSIYGLRTIRADILDAFAAMALEEDPAQAALFVGYATALRGIADSASPRARHVRERLVELLGAARCQILVGEGESTEAAEVGDLVARWLAPFVPDDVEPGGWSH